MKTEKIKYTPPKKSYALNARAYHKGKSGKITPIATIPEQPGLNEGNYPLLLCDALRSLRSHGTHRSNRYSQFPVQSEDGLAIEDGKIVVEMRLNGDIAEHRYETTFPVYDNGGNRVNPDLLLDNLLIEVEARYTEELSTLYAGEQL